VRERGIVVVVGCHSLPEIQGLQPQAEARPQAI
jgi:hypothetical protein